MATMSPLRRRMTEDMTVRNLSRSTQQSYIYAAPPSFLPSVPRSKRRSRPRPSNTPIIASVTQSSPAIASICAPCGGCMVEVRLSPRSPSQQRTEPRCDTS